jgi:hypothetical protein
LLGGRVYGDGWGLREAGGAGRIGGTGRGRLSAPEPAALSPRLAVPFLCCVTGRGTKKAQDLRLRTVLDFLQRFALPV